MSPFFVWLFYFIFLNSRIHCVSFLQSPPWWTDAKYKTHSAEWSTNQGSAAVAEAALIMASGRAHFVRWSDKNQHDGPKHFLLFLGLSFYPLIPRLMKNCTWCSSELSRFRGNNYQCGDLCFSRPDDKHPAPWGMVWKWYNFKRVKFHCFLHPAPPLPNSFIPHPSFPSELLISQKCEHNFFVDGAKKERTRDWGKQ